MKKLVLLMILAATVMSSCEKKITDPVIADFQIEGENHTVGDTVYFINKSENALEYDWNFHDGSLGAHNENPTHVYADTGMHMVSLIAYNDFSDDYKIDSVFIAE